MTISEFRRSLQTDQLPAGSTPALAALWWDGRGDWEQAHNSAQQDESSAGARVHAYLHRKEGDAANARYWYRRAGQTPASGTLTGRVGGDRDRAAG